MGWFWRIVLVGSLLLNSAAAYWILLRQPEPSARPDYRAQAQARWGGLPSAETVILGDSLVELGPWHDVLADPVAVRGQSGATAAEVASWAPEILHGSEDRVIVWAGTNDVLLGQTAGFDERYAQLLAIVRDESPTADVLVLTVPPMGWVQNDVERVNAAIREVAQAAGATAVDVALPVAGERWPDGVHLRPAAYRALAVVLR